MRKTLLLSVAASAIAIPSAFAADLAAPIPAEVYPAPVAQVYDWTGFYAGIHGGYGFGSIEDVANPQAASRSTSGLLGGIQLGYNIQNGNVVWGVEADLSLSDVSAEWGGATEFDSYYGKDKQKAFGTVRARLGYAFDRFMPYVTGGLAWTNNEFSFGCDPARVIATNGCGTPFETKAEGSSFGWTVGGGAEVAVTDRWTLKAEYLYSDYGKISKVMPDPNDAAWDSTARDFKTQNHAIKIGANYRF